MSNVNLLEGLAHPEFFETIDHYTPKEEDFRRLVEELVPSDCRFRRNGVWFGCDPPKEQTAPLPPQGWKIHVSAAASQAKAVLRAIVPILRERRTAFKFSLDHRILTYMNCKQWVRQGAGKFITIYPHDRAEFEALIEELHQVTKEFCGPYILSDRRYKDSKVIFYRYGGILPHSILKVDGEMTPMLVSPSGGSIPDRRLPYFVLPPWTEDPFGGAPGRDPSDTTETSRVPLNNRRYIVRSVLRYSNSGGVYVAEDTTTGQDVVIKEARPFVETTEDAIALLRKEHRILTKVAPLGIAPQPLDFFQEWEHAFLVQELLTGLSLGTFSARHNVTLRPQATLEDTRTFYRQFRTIFTQLADILARLHEAGIVFSDLSPSNLMVSPDTLQLKILDFEAAFEIGVDNPIQIFTEGFAYADQIFGRRPTFESDCFSLGAIMHFFLWPVNQMFMISPRSRYAFIESVTRDIGFPDSIRTLISALLDKHSERRPTPAEVVAILAREEPIAAPWLADTARPVVEPDVLAGYVRDALRYIASVASYDRRDRLFPADGAVFRTNPLGVAHGACGVAYAIHRIEGRAPDEVIAWIRGARVDAERYPPGLYVGLAGIAWVMLELGLRDEAETLMRSVYAHPLRYDAVDVYYGAAGWGLASLKFFMETGNDLYLEGARDAAQHLLATRTVGESGCCWPDQAEIPLGYAHGPSGAALFLLYLHLATGDETLLDVGQSALEFDLNNAFPNGDGLSWPRFAGRNTVVYPYWRYGSAGVGTTVLRYDRLLGGEKYKSVLQKIFVDTNRKYSVLPGFAKGLAGKGEFLLDMYQYTADQRYLDAAHRVANGIALFRIEKKDGLAFPGETLRRISCDYGTGSAGIAHFLHRLGHPAMTRAFDLDALFVLDSASKPCRADVSDAVAV